MPAARAIVGFLWAAFVLCWLVLAGTKMLVPFVF